MSEENKDNQNIMPDDQTDQGTAESLQPEESVSSGGVASIDETAIQPEEAVPTAPISYAAPQAASRVDETPSVVQPEEHYGATPSVAPPPPAQSPGALPYQQQTTGYQASYGQPVQPPTTGYQPAYEQPGQPQTNQPYYAQQVAAVPQSGSGKALGALVCGILAIIFSWTVVPSIILGIVAIVLASQYVKSFGKEGKTTGAKVCGILGIIFSVLAIISYIFIGIIFLAAYNEYENTYNGNSYSYDSDSGNSDSNDSSAPPFAPYGAGEATAVAEATDELMESIKNPSATDLSALADSYEEIFTEMVGVSMADAGLDPQEVVQATLDSVEYEISGVAVSSGDTATTHVDVSACNIWDYLIEFYANVDATGESDESFAADKTKIGDAFRKAMAEAEPFDDDPAVFEWTKVGDTWTVDPDSLEEETSYIYGMY